MEQHDEAKGEQEQHPDIPQNEIRISAKAGVGRYVRYVYNLMEKDEKTFDEVILKAAGRAMEKVVPLVEILKRRIKGLHQLNRITSTTEPRRDGSDRLIVTLEIRLSKNQLTDDGIGYQEPLPESEVEEYKEVMPKEDVEPAEGTRGRGGRGRGSRGGHTGGRGARGSRGARGTSTRGRGRGSGGYGRGYRGGRGRGGRGGRGGYSYNYNYQDDPYYDDYYYDDYYQEGNSNNYYQEGNNNDWGYEKDWGYQEHKEESVPLTRGTRGRGRGTRRGNTRGAGRGRGTA